MVFKEKRSLMWGSSTSPASILDMQLIYWALLNVNCFKMKFDLKSEPIVHFGISSILIGSPRMVDSGGLIYLLHNFT